MLEIKKQKLEAACEPKKIRGKIKYWTSEIYGMGRIYREMAWYPKKWPLNIYSSHGIALADNPAKHELANNAPYMFYFSKRLVRLFNDRSVAKKSFCIISPFVFYRRKHHITPKENTQGTLVFVGHSTPDIDDTSNVQEYIHQLKNIPKKYHPLTICLHFHDINKGMHLDYLNAGFEVVTMGNSMDDDYIPKFYELLRQYKYTCSNLIGSYVHYSVELGIPFFYYGNPPEFINKSL